NDAALTVATKKMFDAAERLEFERAASLKNRIAKLAWLHQRLQQFHANVDRLTFRYRTAGADGNEYEYLVRRGTVRAERVAPIELDEITAWDAEAQRIFTEAVLTGADIPLHDLDEFHLVSSWFRRRPAEKARTSYP
ncbi:MAG: UvrB/UvrC motif-containing protein, partial [Gemmatimonadaceae bacterium]